MGNVKDLLNFFEEECESEQEVYFYDSETNTYYMYNIVSIDENDDVVINIFKI